MFLTGAAVAASDPADPLGVSPPAVAAQSSGAADADASLREWSTRLASDGTFNTPALEPVERAPFGAAHGKFEPVTLERAVFSPATLTTIFWALAVAVAACTILCALWLGKITNPDGSSQRGLTLGSKLSLAFGSLATMLLVVSAMSFGGLRAADNGGREFEDIVADATQAAAIQSDVLRLRMGRWEYAATRKDDGLAQFSNGTASALERIQAMENKMQDPTRLSLVGEIKGAITGYEREMTRLVNATDQLNAIVASQFEPTGRRIGELLTGIAQTASAAGDAELASAADRLYQDILRARIAVSRFVSEGDKADLALARERIQRVVADADTFAAMIQNPTRKLWAAESDQAAEFFQGAFDRVVALAEQVEAIEGGDMSKYGPLAIAKSTELLANISNRQTELNAELGAKFTAVRLQAMVVSTVAVTLAVGISVLLIRALTRAVAKVLAVLQAVAIGDLTREPLNIKTRDEIGQLARATDSMSASLKEIMEDINTSASGVASASTEIAASNEEMSSGLAEQADQVSQVSSATEEMSATSQEVANKSTEGKRVVEETIARIEEIAGEVKASATAVNTLGQKSEEIGQIIAVINDIADQTNLLALNAAIEAARAGEHGRGFAVVADEVRKLAERTTQATEQVGTSIREIQAETEGAVRRMEGGTQKVQGGVEFARQAGDALSSIVAAAEQQSAATIEISQSVEQINSVATQSREGAQQAAAAAAQLSAEAERLQALVRKFKV
jgi:methyl-accepting chemotaxis protein